MTLGLNLLYASLKTDQQRSLAQCMTYSCFIHASIRIAERKLRVCVYTFVLCWVIRPILVLFSVYKGMPKREECNDVRHIDDELKRAIIIEECEWVLLTDWSWFPRWRVAAAGWSERAARLLRPRHLRPRPRRSPKLRWIRRISHYCHWPPRRPRLPLLRIR